MTKATSLKQVDTYLYLSLILKLKELRVDSYSPETPFSREGKKVQVLIELEPSTRTPRHNYERERASRNRNVIIYALWNGQRVPLAYFHIKQKWVKIFQAGFNEMKMQIYLGKFYELFYGNEPFGKVSIEKDKELYRKIIRVMGWVANNSPTFVQEYNTLTTPPIMARDEVVRIINGTPF